MANLIIQENNVDRTLPAVHGEEITIKAPCNCGDVTGVQIAGVVYPFYDAAGKPMEMGTGLFSKDNLIRVLIDTENTRATIINHAITPDTILAAWRDHTHDGSHIVSGLADLATRMGAARIETGSYIAPSAGSVTQTSSKTLTFSFNPSIVIIACGNYDMSNMTHAEEFGIILNGSNATLSTSMRGKTSTISTQAVVGFSWGDNSLTIPGGKNQPLNFYGWQYNYVALA